LQQRSDALRALYNSYLTRYEEAVQRQSFPIPSVRIVTDALLPEDPSSPKTLVILAAAIIAGGFMGVVLGMLNELRERGFRTGAQVRQQLGQRFLGYVPRLQLPRSGSPAEQQKSIRALVRAALTARMDRRWGTPLVETLKTTRLVLQPAADRGTAVVGVLSVLPGEGKSTFALALAEMLSALGSRVLLIDADIGAGRSGLPVRIMPSQQGDWRRVASTDPETGMVTLSAAATEAGGGDLSSVAMQKVLAEARGQFDYVIIDLPAVGPVIDAFSVLPFTDASILVTEWGQTPRRMLRNMLEHEPELADHIIGVVLNKVDLGTLPKFSEAGGLERYAYRGERRIIEHKKEAAPS